MKISKNLVKNAGFDRLLDGKKVGLFTLKNSDGMVVQITNYGGRIVSLFVPDKAGNFEDVVLGHEDLKGYTEVGNPYFGAIIGRYGNRIAKGRLDIDGATHALATNNAPNHLHGGTKGFDKVVWQVEQHSNQQLELTYLSVAGEENYPGNLKVVVTYTLTEDNALEINYQASTDATTVVNLTNHSYFNLKGAGNGSIEDHELTIMASQYLPTDTHAIPTGEIATVANTPMDFRKPKLIGRDMHREFDQLLAAKGYDHTFVFDKDIAPQTPVAIATEKKSGRTLEVYTNEPGVQFYSGNFVTGCNPGKNNKTYLSHESFCLETQHFPDSPNQQHFPSTLVHPGEIYTSFCSYKFGTLR
jgi:aldose 1-epimerase